MSDKPMGNGDAIGILITLAFAIFITWLCEHNSMNAMWQDKAVAAGKAEYYLDDKNERQWRWKP